MAATPAPSAAGPQHYCLRWNNYKSNLTSVFDQLLQSESFVDVTLAVSGRALKAHKVILSASSPYFQTLLHDNPCGHPIVVIEDVSYADMQAIVQFMYKGEINVAEQQLPSLLKVAEALKIRGLADVPDGEALSRGVATDSRGRRVSAEPAGSPEVREPPPPDGWPGRASQQQQQQQQQSQPAVQVSGAPSERPAPPPPQAPAPEQRPAPVPSQVPAPSRVSEDTEIRPAIIEMIKEEERAMMLENSNSWSSPPEPTFQHQLQQAWQKSWNQQQSLLQNLRFRERGPLKSWRPETMAAAIMSVLREGHSLSQAARTYDIPYPTFVLYANRVHNLLGPSQEGPGGIPNELRPKGRGRPQRILLGVWPEETVNNVIRAVVFRDTSGLKEQMESKAAAVAAAAAAAGHSLQDMPASLSKLMHHQQQTPPGVQQPHMNGRPPYCMQGTPPMAPRVGGPSMGGGGGGRGGLPHPAATGARHRPPNLLGFPDMHMMMGMFPHGMLSAGGAVPTINLPPMMDQKPPVCSAGQSPPARPVPGLSSIAGAMSRNDSSETDPTGENSNTSGGGADPASLFEPVQEMTEGEEPLQVRRDLDSPATEGSNSSPASSTAGGGAHQTTHRSTPDALQPPAKRIKDMFGGHPGMAQYRMQGTPPMAPRVGGPSMGGGGGGRGGLPHPAAAGARHRPPNLLGFPDMHMMMGMFPHGMLSAGGAVPTINLPPLMDQKPSMKTESPPPCLPEVTISSVPARTSGSDSASVNGPTGASSAANGPVGAPNGALGRPGSAEEEDEGGADPASLFEPVQEMTEGEEPLQVRRDLDSAATEGSNSSPASSTAHHRSTPDALQQPPAKRIKDMFGGHPGMAQYRMQGTPPMAPRVGGPSMGGRGADPTSLFEPVQEMTEGEELRRDLDSPAGHGSPLDKQMEDVSMYQTPPGGERQTDAEQFAQGQQQTAAGGAEVRGSLTTPPAAALRAGP